MVNSPPLFCVEADRLQLYRVSGRSNRCQRRVPFPFWNRDITQTLFNQSNLTVAVIPMPVYESSETTLSTWHCCGNATAAMYSEWRDGAARPGREFVWTASHPRVPDMVLDSCTNASNEKLKRSISDKVMEDA